MTTQPTLFAMSRAEQIEAEFREFHEANPRVFELFCEFTFMVIKKGRSHYGADAIINQIRWHTTIETDCGDFKINDHYTAHYSRLFHATHPQYDGFFRQRNLSSVKSDPIE